MFKKSKILGLTLITVVLAGCAGSGNKAPISTIGSGSSGGSSAVSGNGIHVVQRGDTMYSIARRYNVPVSRLLSMNNLSNPSQIEVGQRIRVGVGSGLSGGSSAVTQPKDSSYANVTPPKAADASAISWTWPHKGNIISSYSESTRGIDIAGNLGDPVKAAASGTVSYVGNGLRGLGNLVLITHSNGFISAYAHNQRLLVKQNQRVSAGDKIAELGQSDTTSPRLHFEIRRNGTPVNPVSYLPR
ncbi:peptidoglycan DD-metalloendopeptidase family protein [Pelistega sp. MC2]|uniref:peptidoglycan DD-metalloendopeptidase family protein n=1 Tax=Pelistega sp. MC2 TaxID=1720297 RepID=UPI0008DA51EB|nr:peptidoglycan DD-metalloendopeptidase family protein [Pelistega sp. MC2]